MIWRRRMHPLATGRLLTAAGLLWLAAAPQGAGAQGLSATEWRPFVVGIVPVVSGGAVGGVSVDAAGVLARADLQALGRLQDARWKALQPVASEIRSASPLRKISLKRLESAIARRREEGSPLSDEMQYLAGLQRIRYVFVYPGQRDIVLAGPAEGWRVDRGGAIVGLSSGRPVLMLADLVVALRTAESAARGDPIRCSIDPSAEGLARLSRFLRTGGLRAGRTAVAQMEKILGPQRITVGGVPPGSPFARVMVAADFTMKRLAMNMERAPVDGLPSYLELLRRTPDSRLAGSMPRWWMAASYEPLGTDASRMAWELKGQGVRVLTEDGRLTARGEVSDGGKSHPAARRWADLMTTKYSELSDAMPVFAQLRNCIDLAVIGALIWKEDLMGLAGFESQLLMEEKAIQVADLPAPRTTPSRASVVKAGRRWIVTVSGGVEVDPSGVVQNRTTDQVLAAERARGAAPDTDRWWWD